MLTLWGSRQRFCDGLSRRGFLKIGALGAGLTLADLLRLRAAQDATGRQAAEKSVIMIELPGGPPHTDMYDLKPDGPKEYRGEFKPIQTNVAGVQICEHFPLQAQMWDKLAVVRTVVTGAVGHRDHEIQTGYKVPGYPSFGSIISKLRGVGPSGVPPFVTLNTAGGGDPAFLGVAHRPFLPNGPGMRNLTLSNGMTPTRLKKRQALLKGFDELRRDVDSSGTMAGLDAFEARAFDMVVSGNVAKALNVNLEEARTRERYKGVEKFLTARRLVEAGVGAVTMSFGNWDTHLDNFKYCKEWLPQLDRGIAALIQDLHERGLDKDVVVVMWGEFGRDPKVNDRAGREHWEPVMSALIAGGGFRMGQAIGTTSARGEEPKDRPYNVPQVWSTIYRAIGIDPSRTFTDGSGRPVHILEDREPVKELL